MIRSVSGFKVHVSDDVEHMYSDDRPVPFAPK